MSAIKYVKKGFPLHPLFVTTEEFDKIPPAPPGTEHRFTPLGSRFRNDREGSIIVTCTGNDMFADQWGAGLSVPDRGLRYYYPVFPDYQI